LTFSISPSQSVPDTSVARIPSLDGLRGVAILLVLIGHGAYPVAASLAPIVWFAGNGALGVKVFFVLSGYLIYNLSVREAHKYGKFDWKRFYMRRVLRIFPCFYCYIITILVLKGCGLLQLTWPVVISAATFSLNYRHLWDHWSGSCPDYFVLGHYWTLALEEQFYLTWPLLMALVAKRTLLPTLVGVMALAPIARVACYFLTPGSRGQVFMMFHTGCDAIAAGVLLGELLLRARPRAWLEWLSRNDWIVGASIGFLLFGSPLLASRFKGAYALPVGQTLELGCLWIVITAAVWRPRSLLYRVLNYPPLAFVGVLSYSLYVWDNLFLNDEGRWLVNTFPWNWACLVGVALLSYYAVEQPCLRLKDRFHKGGNTSTTDDEPRPRMARLGAR